MAKEALLIVDMSNDFVHDEGSLTAGRAAQAIVPYIVELADRMVRDGHIVAVCMDEHQEGDPHFLDWPPHNVKGTWGQQLYGDLATWYDRERDRDSVMYVPKASYNAFSGTDLAVRLRAFGVERVHIVGVCTDICDFLTAGGAYDAGFATVVHRAGCATFTDQGELFLEHMQRCFHTEIV